MRLRAVLPRLLPAEIMAACPAPCSPGLVIKRVCTGVAMGAAKFMGTLLFKVSVMFFLTRLIPGQRSALTCLPMKHDA